jgi:recombination protein RecT
MNNQNNEVTLNQKQVTKTILNDVEKMQTEGLSLPKNYNASNALNVAFLELVDMKVNRQPLLDVVTPRSIYQSLLNMVLQGLSPAKNQVYFIPYGNELQMQRSYFGTQAVLKRLSGVKNIWAEVIREGEKFEFENDGGRKRLTSHEQKFETLDNEIIGAYAVIDTEEDGQLLEVMTREQIDASWSQAKTSNVHNKFGDQMAMRTVINRAAKNYINTSDDSDLLIHAINDTTENEYDPDARRRDVTEAPKSEKTKSLLDKFQETQPKKTEEAPIEEPEENKDGADTFENQEEPPAEPEEEINPFDEIENAEYADFEEMNEPEEPEEEKPNLTVPKLREKLDELGVKHDSNMRKAELEGLYEMAQNGGVQDDLF